MKMKNCNSLKSLVGAPGFEPGASCAQGRRATRLRYAPTFAHVDSTAFSDFSIGEWASFGNQQECPERVALVAREKARARRECSHRLAESKVELLSGKVIWPG
jgi:hypothetical protein